MTRARQLPLLLGTCLASALLSGCASVEKLNPFLLIDDPLVRTAQQEEVTQQAPTDDEDASASTTAAADLPGAAASITDLVTDQVPPPTAALSTRSAAAPSAPPEEGTQLTPTLPEPALASEPRSVGPVLEEEEPVQLATRLPSAFDFVASEVADEDVEAVPADNEPTVPAAPTPPAPDPFEPIFEDEPNLAALPANEAPAPAAMPAAPPEEDISDLEREAAALGLSVVSALPAPGSSPGQLPGTNREASYREFYDFALGKLDLPSAGGARESVLLLDPPSLDPALQRCGNLPPAVLLDLDPANGLLPLVSNNSPNPELAGYLAVLRQRGVTVYWISGHGPGAASAIRERLQQSAMDPAGNDPLVVTRFAGESKQERRYALGETNCLLAILGDHRADFDELYDFVLDPIMAGPLEVHINQGWFIAPPPLD